MFISKTIMAYSSNTATWEDGKRIKKTCDLNGELVAIKLSLSDSTADALRLYHGTTNSLILNAVRSKTTLVTHRPLGRATVDSTALPAVYYSTGTIRIPWVFANEKIVVCGGTQKSGTVTIYVRGTVGLSSN